MKGRLYPGQVPVSLSMYKSSYTTDFKDFTTYTPHLENPEEQQRVEIQLRQKQFCPNLPTSASMLMKGYPAFKDSQTTAGDLEPCTFSQEVAQKALPSQPMVCTRECCPCLNPQKNPEFNTSYEYKRLPKPTELNYPLPKIGELRDRLTHNSLQIRNLSRFDRVP
ncbi:protein SPMIP9 isoform X2 [Notamacropus eugenii]